MEKESKHLSESRRTEILSILSERFAANTERHKSVVWKEVYHRLTARPEKLWSLNEMERTGGEPDVVAHDKNTDEYIFCDCSSESPSGRRNLCYDRKAMESRKENKPEGNATDMSIAMGIELMNEKQYRDLQNIGDFDMKTSSWLETPVDVRQLGGALFGDKRYGRTFIYHNGAESYYSARGFRGILRV